MGIRSGFFAWLEYIEQQRQLRLGCIALLRATVRRAYNSWEEIARSMSDVNAQLEAALVVLSPRGRMLRAALNTWQEAFRTRQLMHRVLSALVERNVRRAYLAWGEAADERAQQQVRAARVGSRLGKLALVRLVGCANADASPLATLTQALMHRAFGAMSQQGVWRGFSHWVEVASEWGDINSLRLRVCAALGNQGLRRALTTWFERSDALLAGRQMLNRAALGLMSPLLQAFGTWRASVEARALAMRRLTLGKAGFTSAKRRAAYNSWLDFVSSREMMGKT